MTLSSFHFVPEAMELAKTATASWGRPELSQSFLTIIEFLKANPSLASRLRNRSVPIGSNQYIELAAQQFYKSRQISIPATPSTIPDEMVSFILHHWIEIAEDQLERIKQEHLLCMGVENMVGELLERYLATGLEPNGWVWVSGSLIKGVDFLRPPTADFQKWYVLQVKNRNNSENSSSSAIRIGTEIKKWYRTSSNKTGSRWDKFPDNLCRSTFSEEGFREFVKSYLSELKKLSVGLA